MATYRDRGANPKEVGAIQIPDEVNCHYGTAVVVLTRPAGRDMLVLSAEKGRWRFRTGTKVAGDFPPADLPVASVTNGSASVGIKEGADLVIPAPTVCTLKGYAADSLLTYFWL